MLADIIEPGQHIGNVSLSDNNFIVDRVLPLLQILILAVIMRVVKVQPVNLLSQPVLCPRKLAEPFALEFQLLLQLCGVDPAADSFPNRRFKLRGSHQTPDHIGYRVIHNILAPLPMVITAFTVNVETVFTGVVEIITVETAVFFLFAIYISVHPTAANRAFQNTG